MTVDPLIGRQLANYRIERLIGRGGMAAVYYATDIRLNRPAAVKVIDPYFRTRESFAARFIQEARAIAAWRHEHIVQVYHAGEEDGLYYFAMEYVDGLTLAQILSGPAVQGKRLPIPDVLRYGRAIASALDYAHQKGVIHRDVKPLNVLVASDGRVVLTDFGIALDTAQGSIGEVFGSPHYIAPEQARRSNAAVPQSDLYSLGVMLYEMLTGTLPFDDPSPTSVALQHIALPPPSPRQFNPKLSEQAESVLLRALSKNPSDRYPTGKALMDSLETALRASALSPESTQPTLATILTETPANAQPAAFPPLPSPALPVSRTSARLPWLVLVLAVCIFIGTAAAIILNIRETLTARQTTPTLSNFLPAIQSSVTAPAATPLSNLPITPIPANQTSPSGGESAMAPSQTPLDVPAPAVSPADRPADRSPDQPTPTLKYSDGRRFMLYYNETSFYMHQTRGVGDLIAGVAFERLDASDRVLNRFSGSQWAEYSRSSMVDHCFQVDIIGAENYLNPPECGKGILATVHLSSSNTAIFWTPQEDSQAFRVLWQGEELTRCEIPAGACEVNLP